MLSSSFRVCGGGSVARVTAYRVIGSAGARGRMAVVPGEAPRAVKGSITVRPAPDSTIALASEYVCTAMLTRGGGSTALR
ncbi:hypothetical protein D3C76_1670500 [compost metagenome]